MQVQEFVHSIPTQIQVNFRANQATEGVWTSEIHHLRGVVIQVGKTGAFCEG